MFQRTLLLLGWGHVSHSTTLLPQKSAPLGHILALLAMNDLLPAELKFRKNTDPGLRGEKMLTHAIWHGFLAA